MEHDSGAPPGTPAVHMRRVHSLSADGEATLGDGDAASQERLGLLGRAAEEAAPVKRRRLSLSGLTDVAASWYRRGWAWLNDASASSAAPGRSNERRGSHDERPHAPPLPPGSSRKAGAVVAALLTLATYCYSTTLDPIPHPDWLKDNLPRLLQAITVTAACLAAIPLLAYLSPSVSRRSRRAALGAVGAWLLIAFLVDHGAGLDHHGMYNLIVIALVLIPLWGSFACVMTAKAVVGGRRLALAALLTVAVLAPAAYAMKRRLFSQWHAGLLGRRLVDGGHPLSRGWGGASHPALKHTAAKVRGSRSTRGLTVPPPAHIAAAANGTGRVPRWDGCNWPLADVVLPLNDLMPEGLQNFWLGDWRSCPPKAESAFTAAVELDWGGVTAEHVAAARKGCEGHGGAAGTPEAPAPPPSASGPWVPATLHITCPTHLPLRIITLPDAQRYSHAQRAWFALQKTLLADINAPGSAAVLAVRGPGVSKPLATQAAFTHAIPAEAYGETFVIECGADNSTLNINRPSLPTLLRSAAQWGPHGPLTPLLQAELAAAGQTPPSSPPHKPFNVMVVLLDAVSRVHLYRKMPKTMAVLESIHAMGRVAPTAPAGGGKARAAAEAAAAAAAPAPEAAPSDDPPAHVLEFFRYHPVDFATHVTTVPAFTGGCGHGPANEPIWETYRRAGGYVTAHVAGMCEDWSTSFTPYVTYPDHENLLVTCMPDVYPVSDPYGAVYGPYSIRRRCHGDQYEHRTQLAYGRSFWANYADVPKFLELVFLEGHEGSGEVLGLLDDDLASFLHDTLVSGGGASDTALVFMSDHGLHMGVSWLWTLQGRTEHMMASFLMSLPLRYAHPSDGGRRLFGGPALQQVEENTQYLLGSFDLYWTLRALLGGATQGSTGLTGVPGTTAPSLPLPLCGAGDYRPVRPGVGPANATLGAARFYSAFDKVPMRRSCADAHIEAEVCKCT